MPFAARRSRLFLSAFLCLAAFGTGARGETIVHKSISYFTIGGRTAAELDKELERRGPMLSSTGSRHPGATRIRFGGDVTYVQSGGRCRVGNARVTVTTKIMLPRWKHRATAAKNLALLWDTLASDIRRHEERHAEIARTHARDMERALLALPSDKTCASLQQTVARISADQVEIHDRDQARFDRIEAANFENRMIRLLKARMAKQPR
ncbi:DUF922 domain-containing Zn-dependent protease [Gellertiella hungarica]|uniref:Putative secreted Zn-dependent protease n=1 Tax=Gellertiella hungarica TaxID=1572859 RepID=A0A7W6J4G4_9HYPH|nr:DUF922 domain-containing protein [Gellertiella hungarica]MBB4064601.1 putative secreted Zn-dependent protease [Gellertiella hungarica]